MPVAHTAPSSVLENSAGAGKVGWGHGEWKQAEGGQSWTEPGGALTPQSSLLAEGTGDGSWTGPLRWAFRGQDERSLGRLWAQRDGEGRDGGRAQVAMPGGG